MTEDPTMTPTQLTNLKALRDLGRRILAEPANYPLSFGGWDCGTECCLSGWYGRVNHLRRDAAYVYAEELFGINIDQKQKLFAQAKDFGYPGADNLGPAAYAELERRLAYLDTLIAEHEPTELPDLPPVDKPVEIPAEPDWPNPPTGLPESITRIFETEAQA